MPCAGARLLHVFVQEPSSSRILFCVGARWLSLPLYGTVSRTMCRRVSHTWVFRIFVRESSAPVRMRFRRRHSLARASSAWGLQALPPMQEPLCLFVRSSYPMYGGFLPRTLYCMAPLSCVTFLLALKDEVISLSILNSTKSNHSQSMHSI